MSESSHTSTEENSGLIQAISRQHLAAISVMIAVLVLASIMRETEAALASLWILGCAAGFTLQRSRFCFASAFRDLFLFGNSRMMRAIILGLMIATVGFAINMHDEVPFPEFGVLPQQANILPLGISTIVAGLIFGFGMVLAGGCVSGSLYRMAEGYIGSWVSIGGVLIGMGLLSHTWNWWWNTIISHEPRVWLPAKLGLGYSGSVALTLLGLGVVFLAVLWWESRAGLSMPNIQGKSALDVTFQQKLSVIWNSVFVKGWPAALGGATLGIIGIFMYMVHMPWGVTGELARWSNGLMDIIHLSPPTPLGLNDIGGCAGRATESGIFTHTFAVTVGILPGSLIAALSSKEFKLRFPKNPKRYLQSLGGGIFMGYGAALAIGCTIGAFFSSVPSLSVSGWLFALSLAAGAYLGVQAIKRIT